MRRGGGFAPLSPDKKLHSANKQQSVVSGRTRYHVQQLGNGETGYSRSQHGTICLSSPDRRIAGSSGLLDRRVGLSIDDGTAVPWCVRLRYHGVLHWVLMIV